MIQEPSFKVYNASAGSGKTFTLVKEYLKILLTSKNEYIFQNILAITFTNKAAAEMKERVLENLRSFTEDSSNDMFDLIVFESNLNSENLKQKSRRILVNVLQNYSAFNITTIDSFTHKLIRTFAYDLGIPLNFEVEMDGTKLISEAVDILISKIGLNKELTDILVAFSLQKVEDDKAWDVSKELNTIASILINETDAGYVQSLQMKTIADFQKIEKRLKSDTLKIESLFQENGKRGLDLIEQTGLEHKNFSFSDLPKHFIKFTNLSALKYDDIKYVGRLQKNLDNGVFYSKSTKKEIQNSIDAISAELLQIYEEGKLLFQKHHGNYILIKMVLNDIIPLAVLNHIQKELKEIKEQNTICLSAEFNSLISEKIKNEPAPFIYERIGERFKHFFIDEMQDTSAMQWQNLIPLISNTLSQEGGSLMLVGDAKQAIYRWRGGEAEQFIDLSLDEELKKASNPFFTSKNLENLDTNYRSFSEVVVFNNLFFSHLSGFLENPEYKKLYEIGNQQKCNSNIGGYVQLDFIDQQELTSEEKEHSYPAKVLEIVEGLDTNFKREDVCVIVRTKKEGVLIANYLTENGISIISSETLLLNNSLKVQFIINLLTYIQNPLNQNSKFKVLNYLKEFLKLEISDHAFYTELLDLEPVLFFKKLQSYNLLFDYEYFLQMPFYECIEYSIRVFNLLEASDAYVQFFLDYVLEFQRKNYHDLAGFLLDWEVKREKLSVSASENENAVRIMTIHKSKGLEFPVVIFPCERSITQELDPKVWIDNLEESIFGELSLSRVSCAKRIEFTGEMGSSIYRKRQSELFLDNFNLLYVALTRAVEQLYVITEYKLDKKTGEENLNFFSGVFINYLKSLKCKNAWEVSKFSYSFGDQKKSLPLKEDAKIKGFELQKTFVSSPWESHQIKIVSNSSKHWGEAHQSAINYGVLIHEMFSKIITEKDINPVVNSYLNSGFIRQEDVLSITDKIKKVVCHPELNQYFNSGFEILTEREILNKDKNILIPDRLMFKEEKVFIIDFKTGKEESKHAAQLNKYNVILREMGFDVCRKIIVYIWDDVFLKNIN